MRSLAVLVFALLAAGCGVDFWALESIQNSNDPRTTLVLVWLSDSPIDDAEHFEVTIDRVELIGAEGSEVLNAKPQTVDVLSLRNGVRLKVAEEDVPSGAYSVVRLTLRDAGAEAPRIHRQGTWHPVSFGNAPAVIDVPYDLVAPADDRVEVQVDFNVRLSVTEVDAGFELQPRLDALDPLASGEIHGRVEDALGRPVEGAVVIARAGGREIRSTASLPDGRFRLTPLAPGSYAVEVLGAGPLGAQTDVLVHVGGAAEIVLLAQ